MGGAPLFLRITYASDKTGRSVPSMQLSRDGLDWQMNGADGPALLAGSTDPKMFKNCCFLSWRPNPSMVGPGHDLAKCRESGIASCVLGEGENDTGCTMLDNRNRMTS